MMMTKFRLLMISLGLTLGIFSQKGVALENSLASLPTQQTALQKEYLVVLLHGIDHDGEQMSQLMSSVVDIYKAHHPHDDQQSMAEKIEFLYPSAPNGRWFEPPSAFSIAGLMYAALRRESLTKKLDGFHENLMNLRKEVEDRLKYLNLGYDKLIVGGMSQGGMAALTFGLESPQSVKAIISAIGMWVPCDVNAYPQHIILTNGEKDSIVPRSGASRAEDLLHKALLKNPHVPSTNLQIVNFKEDAHEVSKAQLSTIVTFLDDHVFSASSQHKYAMSIPESMVKSVDEASSNELSNREVEALAANFATCFGRLFGQHTA